ncbi:MAG TPA: Asp-tRNA(Asn)/Glu-tRNA(Gln) amidotransferase subunit GatA [Vicinamibacterales bacterium]|nr:Asp-tRNA(Asn)/Glu-tRNA(Gln) amidotransferase subunit GatA [Vicinamibacterales bacterium]
MTGAVTAADVAERVRRGELSAREACEQALARIDAGDAAVHAFIHVCADRARERAAAVDRTRDRGECGPLCGVPVALKDNLCTRGLATTAGSRVLEHYRPVYDATAVARLERAGAVVVGKTNCDEFAMGSSTEHSAFGPTKNPHDHTRTPGGSSGGSAAAVAAGLVPLALGSDTGGSIRQPAALCGVVGLKPTYGRVSRYGLVAFASSLDQIGPLSTTARDAALALNAIAGADPHDATCSTRPVPDYSAALTGDVRDLRIGVPRRVLGEGVDDEILRACDAALASFAGRGAAVLDIDLPHAASAIPVYYLIATAEASSNLARYDGARYGRRAAIDGGDGLAAMYERTRGEGFGAEVKRRIVLGTYVLSAGYYDAYYLKAQQVRTLIGRDYAQALERVDLIALPTTPTPAFRLGERTEDPLQMYLADVFTVGVNLAGLPGISVPCGRSAEGLPIGLQLVGRPFDEATLLRAADAFERDQHPAG